MSCVAITIAQLGCGSELKRWLFFFLTITNTEGPLEKTGGTVSNTTGLLEKAGGDCLKHHWATGLDGWDCHEYGWRGFG